MTTWKECTEERYDEMLGAVPPAAWTGHGFLVGEAMDHRGKNGRPRFEAFVCHEHKFYEATEPMTTDAFLALTDSDIAG